MTDNSTPTVSADIHPDTQPINYQYDLALLAEECGEVVQIVGKTFRFGWDSYDPVSGITNHDLLHSEIGDVLAAVDISVARGMLDPAKLEAAKKRKYEKLKKIIPPVMVNASAINGPAPIRHNETHAALIVIGTLIAAVCISISVGTLVGGHTQAREAQLKAAQAAANCYTDTKITSTDPAVCASLKALGEGREPPETKIVKAPAIIASPPLSPATPPATKSPDKKKSPPAYIIE